MITVKIAFWKLDRDHDVQYQRHDFKIAIRVLIKKDTVRPRSRFQNAALPLNFIHKDEQEQLRVSFDNI